ncbi:capsular biosynthesis protein [Sulfurovum sp. bin170]|nr:capsular biosynthesis protein [Sulfurovum sp. bin170]
MHSHLIPGIDDGAKDMESSIELIKALQKIGYKKLITTPHISDMFPNSHMKILEGYNALKRELIKQGIDIDIEVAAEYYVDEYFEELLEKEELLTFGKENYLLFEFSYFTPPHDIDNLIYDIRLKGYTPILAHPERYLYWHHDFDKYIELKENTDVLFQINLNSISGYYNNDIKNIVERLIKNGMVDFVGSDTHHMTHIKSLKNSLNQASYKKIFKYNNILNSTL